ncbi:MAG: OmpA family protein [Bacteroidales bacterium]|nr:OmpA family protein [Bacteroidales bacterium]
MNKIFSYVLIISVMLLSFTLNAQTKKSVINGCKKAVIEIEKQNYEKALQYLYKALAKDSNYAEIYIRMGDVYNFTLRSCDAAYAYNKALSLLSNPEPILFMFAADEELKCGSYMAAYNNYQRFISLSNNPELLKHVEQNMKKCVFGLEAIQKPVNMTPINMGDKINSEWDEYLATLTADEQEIIYTVRRPRDKNTICAFCATEEDFYSSIKDSTGEWTERNPMGSPINSSYNEGAQTISPDGKYLFFTLCNAESGYGSCDLYWSKRIGGRWSRPRNFGAPVNTNFWESQPSIAPDGKTIYFTSNRPGGEGASDLWKTEMIDEGVFTIPVNLGPNVNTPSEEDAPFIHPDGTTLYFVSEGHPGMGGRDIFFSTLLADNTWSTPKNMGYPINTSADELNIFINASGTQAYYSSDKEGGIGGLDIYYFQLDEHLRPTPVTFMKGKVKDSETGQPLEADIEMIDLNANKVITSTKSDPVTGEFLACIRTGTNVMLNISHPFYLFYSENFYLKTIATELEPVLKDIILQKPAKGSTLVMNNIFFELNQSDLKAESFVELDVLVDFLKKNRNLKIEIGGHTDDIGTDEYNLHLSLERSKSVYQYLIQKGIDGSRLTYKGYGETMPVKSNETEEGRAANRRTEIKVLEN